MAKLTAAQRHALPKSDFVFPKKEAFPVNDKRHARAALSRATPKGPAVVAAVRRKVHAKFPSIHIKGTTLGKMYRK